MEAPAQIMVSVLWAHSALFGQDLIDEGIFNKLYRVAQQKKNHPERHTSHNMWMQ